MTQMRALLIASVLALVLAACGGAEEPEPPSSAAPSAALPACAGGAAVVALPAGVPSDFPLPPGTRVTSASSLTETQHVVGGAIPGDLQDAAGFFDRALPERGYQVGVGDAEGGEAEAPFTGHGFRGRWRVNEIPDCAALKLTLILIRQ
jgi:hypothetical protein